ncbi:transferase spermidine synthase [Iodobacter sp.]|uniref:spermine/spermidine synthase domain-containing protein n=1 Tax=Iodobacter sp. TaxID=1915058 RepID=UPI0026007A15|nr:transferase spermidine synthase [Iodobacter sp.]
MTAIPEYLEQDLYLTTVNGLKSLHFDEQSTQSAMDLDDPYVLALGYSQTMMGFLLFNAQPAHVLIVGLGGGSLPKYCYRHLSECKVTTLEISHEVIALRNEFFIPKDNQRFEIIQADAVKYMADGLASADVIMLDAYNKEGLPAELASESYYDHCRMALSEQGVLVINLWGTDAKLSIYLERLKRIFNGRIWYCRAFNSYNVIVFASNDENHKINWIKLLFLASKLEADHALDLQGIVRRLRAGLVYTG